MNYEYEMPLPNRNKNNMYKVLVYDPDLYHQQIITGYLREQALVNCQSDQGEFILELDAMQYDIVIVSMDFSNNSSMEFLETVHVKNPYLPIIITSTTEKVENVVNAMNSGGCEFLVYPLSEARVLVAFKKAIEMRDQRNEIAYLRRKQDVVYNFDDIIAVSDSMKRILKKLEKYSRTDSTMLITGDTGTGKSFLSGSVHFNSPRKKKPFVKINCANIPEDLLESELFGHEKGSFTGADKLRIGRFEQASGGTIFLDEIGEINLSLQTKLLRVLEEKAFERVGGNKTIYSDVRIIAATNKDLLSLIEEGRFREDLYYRINVLPITLPPLRERQQCIMPLANSLLTKLSKSMHKEIYRFSDASVEIIRTYNWPGNIRQLANTIERAVILEDDNIIHSENISLPEKRKIISSRGLRTNEEKYVEKPSRERKGLVEQEKDLILSALEEVSWSQKRAAEKLGVSPRALNYKIRKFGITHPNWRRNR